MTSVLFSTRFGRGTVGTVLTVADGAPDAAAIVLESLTKDFGKFRALHGVSFSVHPGDVVGFVGPNGSGKTTVMRIAMGLVAATSGSVRILGSTVNLDSAGVRAEIGYLPGTLSLYENMTAREFFDFVAHMRQGRGRMESEALAERLSCPLDTSINSMSKGTKQKVGVIAALMHSPRVLILDEPTSGLDPFIQREFETLIRERRAQGTAVLLSSHVLSEVERVATHVAILNEGRLVAHEKYDEMMSRIEHRVHFTFAPLHTNAEGSNEGMPPRTLFDGYAGVSDVRWEDHTVELAVRGSMADVLRRASQWNVVSMTTHEPSLDDVFLTLTRQDGARSSSVGSHQP